jgi:hypothetical protein
VDGNKTIESCRRLIDLIDRSCRAKAAKDANVPPKVKKASPAESELPDLWRFAERWRSRGKPMRTRYAGGV